MSDTHFKPETVTNRRSVTVTHLNPSQNSPNESEVPPMLEAYYDVITKIENFVDGLMIVDDQCRIVYNKQFLPGTFDLKEKESIGKTPMEVYPNLKAEDSTCYRAIQYGETTVNQIQKLEYMGGGEMLVLDNTFPIMENGKIIGAVSTSKYLDTAALKNFIDLPNMTSSHKDGLYEVKDIVGESAVIRSLKQKLVRVSKASASVLIYGETGSGKELVAQSIHSGSSRRGAMFVSQNCAAIPHTLLESIFFGTTKGSYTGAENKPGLFEIANGGTLFLDELNSMDLSMQAKLLRAIEEKKVTRIGSHEPKKFDVRIIAAVNEHPQSCIDRQLMRPDLFYRLSSVQIKVPSLRERAEDIPMLTDHFIKLFNREYAMTLKGVTPEVAGMLQDYSWPGNVREFKNVIESAFNFATSSHISVEDLPEFMVESAALEQATIGISSLPKGPSGAQPLSKTQASADGQPPNQSPPNYAMTMPPASVSLSDALDDFEKHLILSRSEGIRSLSELAGRLQISKQSLNYKLQKYQLQIRER
ncbi:sigma-54 interaction domain-containing protein [Acidaminobacter sp.]|uniref:sigma-54 interaction domain-containing protein n=1 Tax=Acidaminobacter sp. TaxID=1872102 RepID=UPI00261137AB|nr:sigma 54-interacting transcriptional regulator [Acidaminobacter sp.]